MPHWKLHQLGSVDFQCGIWWDFQPKPHQMTQEMWWKKLVRHMTWNLLLFGWFDLLFAGILFGGVSIVRARTEGFRRAVWQARFGRSANFGAFGEVLAENLTRCHTESSHDYNLVIFSVAFGEILDQNLTKCHKKWQWKRTWWKSPWRIRHVASRLNNIQQRYCPLAIFSNMYRIHY